MLFLLHPFHSSRSSRQQVFSFLPRINSAIRRECASITIAPTIKASFVDKKQLLPITNSSIKCRGLPMIAFYPVLWDFHFHFLCESLSRKIYFPSFFPSSQRRLRHEHKKQGHENGEEDYQRFFTCISTSPIPLSSSFARRKGECCVYLRKIIYVYFSSFDGLRKKHPDSREKSKRIGKYSFRYLRGYLVSCVFGIKSNKSDNALEHAMNFGNLQTIFFRTSVWGMSTTTISKQHRSNMFAFQRPQFISHLGEEIKSRHKLCSSLQHARYKFYQLISPFINCLMGKSHCTFSPLLSQPLLDRHKTRIEPPRKKLCKWSH